MPTDYPVIGEFGCWDYSQISSRLNLVSRVGKIMTPTSEFLVKINFTWVVYGPIWIPIHLALLSIVTVKGEDEYENVIPVVLSVFTHAALFLSTKWSVHASYWLNMRGSKTVSSASHVAFLRQQTEEDYSLLKICSIHRLSDGTMYVDDECKRMYFNKEKGVFEKLSFPTHYPLSFYTKQSGMSTSEVLSHLATPMEIPIPTFLELFKQHAIEPFFVFQLFCVFLWLLDEYWNYALLTLVLLLLLEAQIVKRRIRDLTELRNIKPPVVPLHVKRDGKWAIANSSSLVPGDLVALETSGELPIPADILVLKGAGLVNEAMLTGESSPVLKEAVVSSETVLDMHGSHKSSVLFAGSSLVAIMQGSSRIEGFVLKTGFSTSQGKLIRTILFASSRVSAGSKEAYRFIAVLLTVALVAAGYVLYMGLGDESRSRFKLFLSVSHILTSVIPPEFPVTLSISVTLSLVHLVRNQIFCTEPFRIPTAGQITDCCFDKTGTLTSTEMSFSGLYASTDEAMRVLACCHSLASVSGSGDLVGDPIEKAGFAVASEFSYQDSTDEVIHKPSGEKLKIVKRFPFDATLQRMAVVVSGRSGKRIVMVKGSPERILRECLDKVPANYDSLCADLAGQGLRVLALAIKEVSSVPADRKEAESKCKFVGFAAFSYSIKPGTQKTISTITNAGLRCCMITGDHSLTAYHVAKNVGLSPAEHQVVVLNTRSNFFSNFNFANKTLVVEGDPSGAIKAGLVSKVAVWARASPDHKREIVAALVKEGRVPLFCGDGTNDVAALKAAPIGIALMEACSSVAGKLLQKVRGRNGPLPQTPLEEDLLQLVARPGNASIAAPFAHRGDTIRCVPLLVRSGRASLALVIQMYKTLAVNSLITAFCLAVMTLYGVKLGDTQTAFEALFMSILSFMMNRFPPARTLPTASFKPVSSVFTVSVLVSIFAQSMLHLILLSYGQSQIERREKIDIDAKFAPSSANSMAFVQLFAAHISACIANFEGPPSLPSLFSSRPVVVFLVASVGMVFILAAEAMPDLNSSFELVPLGSDILVSLTAMHLVGGAAIGYLIRRVFERV